MLSFVKKYVIIGLFGESTGLFNQMETISFRARHFLWKKSVEKFFFTNESSKRIFCTFAARKSDYYLTINKLRTGAYG